MKNTEDFYENLANILNEKNLSIALKLSRQITEESNDRRAWFKNITDGLEALGIVASKKTPNDQNSNIVNSSFLKTFISLSGTFCAELFPAGKILKGELKNIASINESPNIKEHIQSLESFARIAESDLNKKLLIEWDEWIPTISKGMQSAFLTGSAIFKIYQDDFYGHPTICHLKPEDVLISPNAKSLQSAESIIHLFELSPIQVKSYENSGFFIKTNLFPSENEIEANLQVKKEREKFNRIDENSSYTRQNYQLAEAYIWLSREDFDDPYISENPLYSSKMKRRYFPYRLIMSLQNPQFLNVTRAWMPNITNKIVRDLPLVQMNYMPGEPFWGLGLTDLCQKLHQRASSIQTELEVALRYNAAPFGFISKDLVPKNSQISVKPGSLVQLESSNLGPIRENFIDWKFSSPPPMFYEYMQKLENDIQVMVGLSQIKPENISNIAASTLFALLDKESKPMSGVLFRFTQSLNQMFLILQQIMCTDIGDEIFGDGSLGLTNSQVYGNPIDFLSACDPTLSNSALRVLQMQTVLQSAMEAPQIHNLYEIFQRLYDSLQIPNSSNLLKSKEEIQQENEAQAQASQAQAQAQNNVVMQQNQLLASELELNMKKADQDYQIEIEKLKLSQAELMNKIQNADIKTQAEIQTQMLKLSQQEKIEQAKFFQTYSKYLIERAKLASETGINLPENPMRI